MKRIDTTHKVTDANGTGKDGFGPGDPGLTGATEIDDTWANNVQEEIAAVIEAYGLTLDGTNKNQLLAAIRRGPPIATYGWPSGTGFLASGATFPLTAGTGDLAPASIYTLSSNKITVSEKGVYRVSVAFLFTAQTGPVDALIAKIVTTGGLNFAIEGITEDSAGEETYLSASILVALDVGEQVWLINGPTTAGAGGVAFGTTFSQVNIEQVKKL